MASPEVLGLAKQGDPAAIATLMNQVTHPKGISVRVKQQDDCLHILFEGAQIPKQDTAVSFVRSSLDILKLHRLKTVIIYGRQQGSHHTSWHESLQLPSYFDLDPNEKLTDEGAIEVDRNEEEAVEQQGMGRLPLATSDIVTPGIGTPDIATPDIVTSDIDLSSPNPIDLMEENLMEEDLMEEDLMDEPELEPVPPLFELPTEATPYVPTPMETSSLAKRPETVLAEASEIPDYLKRPEAVIYLLFTTVFIFWEAYLSLLNELAPETSLSCRQLSQRLGVSKSTVRKRKRQQGFGEWSRSLDPEGITWVYQTGGLYRPKD